MKPGLVAELVCPVCRATLTLQAAQGQDSEVESGTLRCTGCARMYPIRLGVPRLLPHDLTPLDQRIGAAFSYEWTHFHIDYAQVAEHFLHWLTPLTAADMAGKRVLDA